MSDQLQHPSDLPGRPCPGADVEANAPASQASPARPTRRSAAGQRPLQLSGHVAIVDDEPLTVQIVQRHLQDAGVERFTTTSDASTAVPLIAANPPDVLILDIMMPQVSGLEILQAVRANSATRHTPVLILTVVTEASVKVQALRLGATDFLRKPVDPFDLIPRVRNALLTKKYQDKLARENARLQEQVRQQTAEVAASREEVVHLLARAAEYHHDETGQHVNRVGRIAGIIARQLGLDTEYVELLELAAQLHDLGKIAIPDAILHHPGKLDAEQMACMQMHCGYARKILQPTYRRKQLISRKSASRAARLPETRLSPLLMLAGRITQTHHEWWDGTGYPLALAGEDIPIEGRITAVADVYDALSSKRPYKPALPREECLAMMEEGRDTHFDPTVLDAFFAGIDEILQVQAEYADE